MPKPAVAALVRQHEARNHPRPDVPPPVLVLASNRKHTAETILRAWKEGRSPHTLRAMEYDTGTFARFLSRSLNISPIMSAVRALDFLFKQSAPSAHEILLAWRAHLLTACGLSPSTVNRHLATIRSVSRLARMLGLTDWMLEVPGVKGERRRDSRGPTPEQVRELLALTSGDTEPETRDYALIAVTYCAALRVSELVALDLADVNLDRGELWLHPTKNRRERQSHPLAMPGCEALRRYLKWRGTSPGPLIRTRGNRGKARDGRLETRSVNRILRRLGEKKGIVLRPHGLRHTSITVASELGQRAGIPLEKIRAHSRHATITTLVNYVDEHQRERTAQALAHLVGTTLL